MSKIHFHNKNYNVIDDMIGERVWKGGGRQQEPQPAQQAPPPQPVQQAQPPQTAWDKYWETITEGIPGQQVDTWMKEWDKDPNFPWREIIQDYANVTQAGETPAFKVDPEGKLNMGFDVYSPPGKKVGMLNPELAQPFNWNEKQLNTFNETTRDFVYSLQGSQFGPQYSPSRLITEREQARGGAGRPEMKGRSPVGFGGGLISSESGINPAEMVLGSAGGVPASLEEQIGGGAENIPEMAKLSLSGMV